MRKRKPTMRRIAVGLTIALTAAAAAVAAPADPAARLHDLIDREWEARLQASPLLASEAGRREYDARLGSATAEERRRQEEVWTAFAEELRGIPLDRLTAEDRDHAVLLAFDIDDRLAGHRFREWQVPLTSEWGFDVGLSMMPRRVRIRDLEGARAYLARLGEIPRVFAEQTANLREGLVEGRTPPRAVIEGRDALPRAVGETDPASSPFLRPLADLPPTIAARERTTLRREAEAVVRDEVLPAYRRFADFLRDEYVPGCRTSVGASELPDGRAYYQNRVRHFTTLDRTPERVHEIGLDEVARIRAEMETVMRATGFEGDLAAFLEFLRTAPRFYAKTPEEILMRAAWIAKRIDGKLPALFGRLPRLPYTVEPVPDALAPTFTGGRYVPAEPGGTEPGRYWVNTYALDSRPLYVLEALTLHEAVPGHHLQGALAGEMKDLPEFRRHLYVSAFGEGWALYAERLGKEVGFYADPYAEFGRLTYEMWRACRLVVDTGLHAMGWTRERAREYLAAHTALSLHEVATEVDRYITWPGQALAYKIGEIEIVALRREAERRLGERFDLRAFHDRVLAGGSVTLPILRERVESWIRGLEGAADSRID